MGSVEIDINDLQTIMDLAWNHRGSFVVFPVGEEQERGRFKRFASQLIRIRRFTERHRLRELAAEFGLVINERSVDDETNSL